MIKAPSSLQGVSEYRLRPQRPLNCLHMAFSLDDRLSVTFSIPCCRNLLIAAHYPQSLLLAALLQETCSLDNNFICGKVTPCMVLLFPTAGVVSPAVRYHVFAFFGRHVTLL